MRLRDRSVGVVEGHGKVWYLNPEMAEAYPFRVFEGGRVQYAYLRDATLEETFAFEVDEKSGKVATDELRRRDEADVVRLIKLKMWTVQHK